MPLILLRTKIKAPKQICFDLARSIDLHKLTTAGTQEEAIDGVRSGLINLNEFVTWRARHLGFTQHLTSRITAMQIPDYFTDEMEKGIFKSLKHEHNFEEKEGTTLMSDKFNYQSPLGFLGKIADWLFLKKYLTQVLVKRNEVIKDFAESGKWKEVLSNS